MNPFGVLLLLFLVVPLVEIYLLIQAGGAIGALNTVALVVLTAVAGAWLLRWQGLATLAVSERLAACVNIVPGLTSVYRWEGAVQRDAEVLLLAKTRADRYPALERALVAAHPYELPEVVAVSLSHGLPGYLAWLDSALDDTP